MRKKIGEIKSIAFVVWLFPKLSETFILNQIIELKKLGYKILILAVKDPRKKLAKEDLEYEKIIHEGVKKYRLLNLVKYGSPKELAIFIKKKIKKIDIVYFQFPDLAAEILRYGEIQCPTIAVFHDIPKPLNKKDFYNLQKKYRIVFEKATLILAISEFTKNELVRLGCKRHKIFVHHMGVDTNIFKPSNKKIPLIPFKFVMIGRFVEKKGFIYGIKAFHKVLKNYYKYLPRLLIIGDGILREILHKEVRHLKIENNVEFLGKISQKRVVKILQTSHSLICPSITTGEGKREGLPIVIMEAAACGLPIIATNHAAIPEILKNGRGILVKEKSVQELAKAMGKIIQNYKNLRKKFGERGREIILKEYNIKKLIKRLLAIFYLAKSIKTQELALKKFVRYIKKYLSEEIFSIFLTGSLARYENLTKESDIDLIIVFKDRSFLTAESLLKLKKAINLLKKNSRLKVTPQIFTRFDLFQLLSPILMKNYLEDGKTIFGRDISKFFQKRLFSLSNFEYDIALLKRCLFERFFFRQYLINSRNYVYSFYNKIAKTILFLARDFLFLSKNVAVTKREEIAENFFTYYKNNIPLEAFKIIRDGKIPKKPFERKLFVVQAVNFIENICNEIIKFIKKKYPKRKIYVSPF
jgi:colanic acid/amylovoran biosynthesis glycosyltransferase